MQEAFVRGRRLKFALSLLALSSLLVVVAGEPAKATEIHVLSAAALRSSLNEILPDFERSSTYKTKAEFGTAGALVLRIEKDHQADVAIVTGGQIDQLQDQGKIIAGSKANIASVGIGIFTRRDALKPKIGSIEAFKRALLAAKSIGHIDPSAGAPSGAFVARLLSSLDIASDLKPKIKSLPTGPAMFRAVAGGDVDIAFGQVTEIMEWPSVQLVGPLPSAIQNYTSFAVGIVARSEHQDPAKSLISFLRSPSAAAVMKAKGLEPAQN
jgi:molybdate transport system substrate-binding protein